VTFQLRHLDIDCTQLEAAVSRATRAVTSPTPSAIPSISMPSPTSAGAQPLAIEDVATPSCHLQSQGVGTFGDISTASFYPAHHITMGEASPS